MRCSIVFILLVVLSIAHSGAAQPPTDVGVVPVGPPHDNGADIASGIGTLDTPVPFISLPSDLLGLGRRDVWPVLAAGAVVSLASAATVDEPVALRLAQGGQGSTAFGLIQTEVGSVAGETTFQIGVPLALYAAGQIGNYHKLASLGSKLVRAQLLNGVLTKTIKATRRKRPGGAPDVAVGSLPSGHTSSAAANATIVWRELGWKAGLPTALMAGYIGASRLEQWHYLSDVVFGAAIGVASALAVDGGSEGGFSIAPAVGPGVYGVTLSFGGWPAGSPPPGSLTQQPDGFHRPDHWMRPEGTVELEYGGQVWSQSNR